MGTPSYLPIFSPVTSNRSRSLCERKLGQDSFSLLSRRIVRYSNPQILKWFLVVFDITENFMVMLSRPSRSRCLGTVDRQYEDSCKNEIRSYFIFLTDTVEYSVLHQNRKVQSSFSITAMLGRDESGRCREVAVTGTQGCNVTHFFREHIMLAVFHNGNNPIVNDIIV